MRILRSVILLAGLFFFLYPAAAFCAEYDGDQIVLSWSEDNAHTQTITWHSAGKQEGYVQYSRKGQKLSAANQVKAQIIEVGKQGYYRYEAVIKGLSGNTAYDYRIGDGERWSRTRNFVTAPPRASKEGKPADPQEDASFEFLYMGDIQYRQRTRDYPAWGKLAQDIRQRNPGIAFALTGGDMVNSSRKMKDWNLFLQAAAPVFSYIPLMAVIGNHETSVKADYYMEMLALPENGPAGLEEEFYSFDYGNCHITVLNTCFFLESRKACETDWEKKRKEISSWLQEDLESSDAKWRIVAMHHPIYGISDQDPIYEQLREEWEPIFEQGKVDLVFCGHQHLYMRTKEIGGITYIMGNSGKRRSTAYDGENAPDYSAALDAVSSNYQIVSVSGRELSVTSYDEEGQIMDKWTKKAENFSGLKAAAAGLLIMLFLLSGALAALKKWKQR